MAHSDQEMSDGVEGSDSEEAVDKKGHGRRSRRIPRRHYRVPMYDSESPTPSESEPELSSDDEEEEQDSLGHTATDISDHPSDVSSQPLKTMSVNALHGGEVHSSSAFQPGAQDELVVSGRTAQEGGESPSSHLQGSGRQQRQGLGQLATAAASKLPQARLRVTCGGQTFTAHPRPSSLPMEQTTCYHNQRQGVLVEGAAHRSQPLPQQRVHHDQQVSHKPAAHNSSGRSASPADIQGAVQGLPRYPTTASANPLLAPLDCPPMVSTHQIEPVVWMSVPGVLCYPVASTALGRQPQLHTDSHGLRPEGRVSATFTPYAAQQHGMGPWTLESTARLEGIPRGTSHFTFTPPGRSLAAQFAQLNTHQLPPNHHQPHTVTTGHGSQGNATSMSPTLPSHSYDADNSANIAADAPPAGLAGRRTIAL